MSQLRAPVRRRAATVLPVVAAVVVLAIAWPTAHVQVGLPPAVAFPVGLLAAAPVLLVVRRPALGWTVSALGALLLGLLVDPGPGSSWPIPVVYALALLLLLGAVAACEAPWVVALTAIGTVAVAGPALRAAEWSLLAVPAVAVVLGLGLLLRLLVASRRALHRSEELTEAEQTRRGVLQERARIAHDLHDVVAHSMSMVVVRAETARYRLPAVTDDVAAEFAALAEAARSALGDVRGVLGVLRTEGDAPPEHRPQPTLDDVDDLLAQTRAAGVPLDVATHGDPGTVGAATAVSLYRILQEALANAARHAAGAPVALVVDHGADEVHVQVAHGPGRSSGPGSGLGLPGMRARAAAVGGVLDAGPTPDGGFVVDVRLPTRADVLERA